jgi:predicted PurR-regulated permease PerM
MSTKDSINISLGSIIRFFVIGIGIAAFYFLRKYIALFLAAAVIATAIEAPASVLIKRRWPRFVAVTLVYLLGLAIFLGILYFLIPVIVEQTEIVIQKLLKFMSSMRLPFLPSLDKILFQNISVAIPQFGQSATQAISLISWIVSGIFNFILVMIVSYYLALQGGWVEKTIRLFASSKYEDYLISLWRRAERKIGKWFYTQIILSILVAIPTFFGLKIIGIEYALLISIIAGALEIVPIAGPIIAGVIAVFISAQQDINLALYVIGLFFVVQQLENHILVPILMRQSVGLNPVVVIFSLLVGGAIAGFWGVLIAIPIVAAASEFFVDLEKRKINPEL